MKLEDAAIRMMITQVLDSPKYRRIGLNPITVETLIRQEALQHLHQKQILKSVRRKLHNIVAPYLGEPDYHALTEKLDQLEDYSLESPEVISFCTNVLSQHASTEERIPHLSSFYSQLFAAIGQPETILDLACGLHPFGLPWMGLSASVNYHAYDIIQTRVDFINHFFNKIGMQPLTQNRDILVSPPTIHADLGLFFKEAHRFDKRQPGSNRSFWESLKVDTLAVSLPTENLSGSHKLIDTHRNLVQRNLPKNRQVQEIQLGNEIIFLITGRGG